MMYALAALLLAAAPVKPPPKIELPKPSAPAIDLKMPEVPKTEGLSGPEKEKQQETRQAPGGLRTSEPGAQGPVKVDAVIHAFDFKASREGYKPLKKIDALTVGTLPTKIPGFKTCVRVTSPDGRPVTVKTVVRSPSGDELMSAKEEMTFGQGTTNDLIIAWEGFDLHRTGDLKVLVFLDGTPGGEFPLPVKGK